MSHLRVKMFPAILAAFPAVLAAAAASGCAGESYFCDETGCYTCDGVGCREVDPPQRNQCLGGDAECGPGEVCTVLGCTVGCESDEDCERGTTCRIEEGESTGLCVSPTEDPEPDCQSNEDCDDSQVCIDGACTPDPGNCQEDSDCSDGSVCVEGECREQDDTCRFSSSCGDGRVCVDQVCTTACSPENPCPEGQTCGADGFCVETPPVEDQCVESNECGDGEVCVDTSCFDECTEDAECGEGFFCYAGRCRVDNRPRPFCDNDSDCARGAVCREGVCRSPCSENMDCPAFDPTLTFCVELLCVTTNEATSDCSRQSDCDSDESCVDGVCG